MKLTATVLASAALLISSEAAGQAAKYCSSDASRALVLSGGGAKGAFEVGALWHLIKHRRCDFADISGVSVGALNGAILAQAPRGEDATSSLQNMTRAVEQLRSFWLELRGNDDIYETRFLGTVGFVLFGRKSMYDSTPLAKRLAKAVDPTEIANSGRRFRVGVVSMRDGVYYELSPRSRPPSDDCRATRNRKYLAAILASASMPALFPTPFIRNVEDMTSCEDDVSSDESDQFEPFADGGVSHSTPVPGYFQQPFFVPRLNTNADTRPQRMASHELPSHLPPLDELVVLLASPYSPRTANPPGSEQEKVRLKGGMDMLKSTIDRTLTAPWRWDMNYALMSNGLLQWKDGVLSDVNRSLANSSPEVKTALEPIRTQLLPPAPEFPDVGFPLSSANIDGRNIPARYDLKWAAFNPQGIGVETLEFDPSRLAKAVESGCRQMNRVLVDRYHWSDFWEMCDDSLPRERR